MFDYRPAVSGYTAFSVLATAWRMKVGMAVVEAETPTSSKVDDEAGLQLLQALLQSRVTLCVLANMGISALVLVSLATKKIFLGKLSSAEAQKLMERLANYAVFKVFFLTAVVKFEGMELSLWFSWFVLLGYLKAFSGLARDRVERLSASPAASLWAHVRTVALLALVLTLDIIWMRVCSVVFRNAGTSNLLLLLFEAVIIAIEACQALVAYMLQVPEMGGAWGVWGAAAFAEVRGSLLFHSTCLLEVVATLLTLLHYLHVWWLHGLQLHLIDAVLFLNVRAQVSCLQKRVGGLLLYWRATRNLREAFPDATPQELHALQDDCAICKEAMAAAKKLPCGHLFHLACLRSWFEQGGGDNYSCPTCRACLLEGGAGRKAAAAAAGSSAAGALPGSAAAVLGITPQMVAEQEAILAALQASRAVQAAAAAVGVTVGRMDVPPRGWGPGGRGGGWQQPGELATTAQRSGSHPEVVGAEGHGGAGGNAGEALGAERHWRSWGLRLFSGHDRQRATHASGQASTSRRHPLPARVPPGGMPGDLRLDSMVAAVREILPHISEEEIRRELRQTNSVALTVDSLLRSS